MSKPKRRAGSANYYAQRAVPKDLKGLLGKSPLWKTLGTPKLEEAKPLERDQQHRWDALFKFEREKLKAAAVFNPASVSTAGQRGDRIEVSEPPFDEHGRLVVEPDYDDLSPEEQRRLL